jgi:hypothetical protein
MRQRSKAKAVEAKAEKGSVYVDDSALVRAKEKTRSLTQRRRGHRVLRRKKEFTTLR